MSTILKEANASRAFADLLVAADECKRLHRDAGVPVPHRLQRFLEDDNEAQRRENGERAGRLIPPPTRPPAPPQAEDEWVWIDIDQIQTTTLALGILRGAVGTPMHTAEIADRCRAYMPNVNKGTIANIGTRLVLKGVIARSVDSGWSLVRPEDAPILHEGRAWGPARVFDSHEIAAHRRTGILHLLDQQPDGLQVMQITNMLRERCPWNRAPVTKDLVKADMEALDARGLAKRVGNSGKWRRADQ